MVETTLEKLQKIQRIADKAPYHQKLSVWELEINWLIKELEGKK